MNDIEILEKTMKSLKKHNLNYIMINFNEIEQAIENLLKERQADKDRINILRDRVQENERTLKDLTNTFAKEKQKYENDIDILMNRIDEYKINTVWKYTVKEDYIPKSLVKEKIKEYKSKQDIKDNTVYTFKEVVQTWIELLQELLGEMQ